jgi:hypothetical protein
MKDSKLIIKITFERLCKKSDTQNEFPFFVSLEPYPYKDEKRYVLREEWYKRHTLWIPEKYHKKAQQKLIPRTITDDDVLYYWVNESVEIVKKSLYGFDKELKFKSAILRKLKENDNIKNEWLSPSYVCKNFENIIFTANYY